MKLGTETPLEMKEIATKTNELITELIETSRPQPHSLLVVGCSSSEIIGGQIGRMSNPDVAMCVFDSIYRVTKKYDLCLAAQCCEHLNRALVVELNTAIDFNYTIVNAIPQVKAGGGFATSAYKCFNNPVLVEAVSADLGIDIGQTLIGMHMRPVAVPVRLSVNQIGNAIVSCARSRPKYIGGERAIYKKI